MDNYNYPAGSDTSEAPWNHVDLPEREIEVLISVTLSKTVNVRVKDYKIEERIDKEGTYNVYNYDNCNLHDAVCNQVILPQDIAGSVKSTFNQDMPSSLTKIISDGEDWSVDELEIIKE